MPEHQVSYDWRPMDSAPTTRAIFLSADPVADPAGVLVQWYRTRTKLFGRRNWEVREYFRAVITRREIDFKPLCWREAAGPAARGADVAHNHALAAEQARLARAQAAVAVPPAEQRGNAEVDSWDPALLRYSDDEGGEQDETDPGYDGPEMPMMPRRRGRPPKNRDFPVTSPHLPTTEEAA